MLGEGGCHILYLPGLLRAIHTVGVLLAVSLQNRQEVLRWGTILNSHFCKTTEQRGPLGCQMVMEQQ